ncbi:hypothetical protein F503_02361 [Ophiostoma piceae UAMH 11346]|uniref:DUF7728 domain-containing protein n=1 Tax=Ophiostoma piceae (strain UAMH 11346) TaxID=1262450 RepID=S3BYK0_OPHP1|nr:hypothetical protein F503_02361 [Ophiostoma piceae UAMH 11346]
MLPKALLAAALASSTASAFLLPSSFDAPPPGADNGHHRHHPGKNIEAAAGDEANADAMSLVSPFYHEFTKVKVPCPGCAMQVRTRGRKHRKHRKHRKDDEKKETEETFAKVDAKNDDAKTDNAKIITITDIANHINLFIKIDHTPGQDRLLVNGLELYPDVDVHGGALMAAQVPDRFDHPPHHPHHGEHDEHTHDEGDKPHHRHHDDDHEEHHEEHHDKKEEGESELKMRLRRHRKGGPVEDEDEMVEVKHRKGHKWHGDHEFEAKEGDVPPPPHHNGPPPPHHHDGPPPPPHHDGPRPPPHHNGPPPPPHHNGPPPPPHHDGPPPPPGMAFPGKHGKHAKPLVEVPLGYSMQAKTVGQDPASGMDIVSLTLQIIEVNNVFVQEIPAVNVRLIRTAEGGLMIARIDVGDEKNSDDTTANSSDETTRRPFGHHHHDNGKDRMASLREELDKCSNLLCRWKTIISSSMHSHHGGCAGKAMGKGGPKGSDADGTSDDTRPHHHHDKKPGHNNGEDMPPPHRHHAHSWVHFVKKFASLILFPVLIGVVAGIAASLIGMLVGSLMIGLWRMFFRRGQTGATHQRRHRRISKAGLRYLEEQAADEEKAGLMAEAETEAETEAEPEAVAAPLSAAMTEAEAEAAPLMVTPPQAELPPYEDRDSKTSFA